MAYDKQISTIQVSISSAKRVLNLLNEEYIISSAYGSDISEALGDLGYAKYAADEIEDEPDREEDVPDVDNIYRCSQEIDSKLHEVSNKLDQIEELASEIRTETRSYH